MRNPLLPGAGPPRAPIAPRRLAARPTVACLAAGIVVATSAWAAPPDVQMRRARFALSRGATGQAVADLDAVRRADPGSPRGLEAALLLADLRFSAGDGASAEALLEEAEQAADESLAAPIRLARGWLALGLESPDRARARFADARTAPLPLVRAVAEIGLAWSALVEGHAPADPTPLAAIALDDGSPWLRFAARWTLARAHAAAGDHRRALRELRRIRREARGTSQEDDAELALGLAQLDAGQLRAARRTFRRLDRRFGRGVSRSPVATGLRFEDLRASDADLAARVSALYAAREPQSMDLVSFLGALLDRRAADDAGPALRLAEQRLEEMEGNR